MQELIGVMTGAAIGGVVRYWLSGVIGKYCGEDIPWGTIAVNISGAFMIGLIGAFLLSLPAGTAFYGLSLWHFYVIGFMGSYTTVSSFSLQTLTLLYNGETRNAAINIILTILPGLAAVSAGYLAGDILLTDLAGVVPS